MRYDEELIWLAKRVANRTKEDHELHNIAVDVLERERRGREPYTFSERIYEMFEEFLGDAHVQRAA